MAASEPKTYTSSESLSSLSVYSGRLHVGWICEIDGQHQAYAADGGLLGNFPTRIAAARAFSEVRS